MNLSRSYIGDFIGLLFPDLCQACGKNLYHQEELICTDCRYHLPYTNFHHHPDNPVAQQFWGRVPLKAATALFYFTKGGKVQHLIHQLKYNNRPEIGKEIGKIAGVKLLESKIFASVNVIVPVPLHRSKQLLRGYNQSAYFAAGLSERMQIPVNENNLIRQHATESQTHRARFSRYENMKDVFVIKDSTAFANKHILLTDDIITTGATLEACINVLLLVPGVKLSVAAIAFTD